MKTVISLIRKTLLKRYEVTVIALIAKLTNLVVILRMKRQQVYEVIQKAHRLFKVIESSD